MKRWWMMTGLLLLVIVLAACGGNDEESPSGGAGGNPTAAPAVNTVATAPTLTPVPTSTPRPSSPRSLSEPDGDPQAFEAPYSAGGFVRETAAGNAVSPQTGGLRVTYKHSGGTIVLTVYHFTTVAEATQTVEFTLSASSIDTLLDDMYTAPASAFGIAQDRHGGYIAAWSRNQWAYIARTTGERAVLDEFLSVFPY